MHPAFIFPFGEVVFFIPGNACYVKAFSEAGPTLSICINHIISGTFIIFLKHGYINNVLADKRFFRNLYHFHDTAFCKSDDVIKI